MELKLIGVSVENYNTLKKLGAMGDTSNDVIDQLLKEHKSKHKTLEVSAR